MLRFLTAGESHGKALISVLEGMVSNLPLTQEYINNELSKRQKGLGRSERMKLEKDTAEILSGVRNGRTIGSPIGLIIKNIDNADRPESVTKLRPGHADLAGCIKYNQKDIRNILERASARETASRVAIGAITKRFLEEFNINVKSEVVSIGGSKEEKEWEKLVNKAKEEGDTLGGVFEVIISGAPMGLGSHVHFDRKLDGRLAQAIMSIQAIKGVEVGMGFSAANVQGSKVHDEIEFDKKFKHGTNNAGGIEGGISNGEPVVIRAAMKPLATMKKPLRSVDLETKQSCEAHFERADVCAVHAAAVIAGNAAAFVIADAFLEKFGGDSLEEVKAHYRTQL